MRAGRVPGWMLLIGNSIAAFAAPLECASLKNAKLADTQITEVRSVAAGVFAPANHAAAPGAIFSALPAFCRVVGVIRPTTGPMPSAFRPTRV